MKKRLAALMLCFALLLTATVPYTLAVESETNVQPASSITANESQNDGSSAESDASSESTPASSESSSSSESTPVSSAVTNEASSQQPSAEEIQEFYKTVVFTDAGPFLPPVTVTSTARLMRSALRSATVEADNGLETSKTVVANADGTYTITMEAYTTGTVTTTTTTTPVDIVLVLDQSGSMAYNFAGNTTSTGTDRRQYAMKQAVNKFIDAVNKKYNADTADHRMAIVTFGSSASTLQGWTTVDDAGVTTLQNKINGLPASPSGATNVAAGMTKAETLMGTDYKYTGTNKTRQKVVIVFTDGVPTTSTDFDTGVATGAIDSAKNLKDAGVTVYSVGIFNGADPDQLYGNKWDYLVYSDITCTGAVGTYWGGSWLASLFGRNDFDPVDVPAGNRFLNYLSSNFAESTTIGVEKDTYNPGDNLGGSGTGYQITANFDRTASNYYLTASNSDSLNTIFQQISTNIATPSIALDSTTVIKDFIAPQFEVITDADNTPSVSLFTADYNGNGFNEKTSAPSSVNAAVTDGVVSVNGFNFNENFVSKTDKGSNDYGKKLIIEVTIKPKTGFLGGNNVYTNLDTSGVYTSNGSSVELFNRPTVDIDIPSIVATATDKNVYLLGRLTADQLKANATVKVGNDVSLDLSAENYGLEPWQTAYVNITPTFTHDSSATAIAADGLVNIAEDDTYTLAVTIEPSIVKENGVQSQSGSATAKINVFKPELTFKDSDVYYGDEVPADFAANLKDTQWKHNNVEATTTMGAAPALTLTYTPETSKITTDGKVNTKQDIGVDVSVKIGTTDVTEYTKFVHTACSVNETVSENAKFLLHVKTCTLTITKTGGTEGEPYVFTIFKDGEAYTEATIVPTSEESSNTVKICELPVGTYTIKEDAGWSWRFSPTYSPTGVTLSNTTSTDTITCNNTSKNNQWLNGYSDVAKNIYGISNAKTDAN